MSQRAAIHRYWLVYCGDGPDRGTVIVTDQPYGFDTAECYEKEVPDQFDAAAASSGEVCADSFEEFICRLWIENELFFTSLPAEQNVDDRVADYGECLRARL